MQSRDNIARGFLSAHTFSLLTRGRGKSSLSGKESKSMLVLSLHTHSLLMWDCCYHHTACGVSSDSPFRGLIRWAAWIALFKWAQHRAANLYHQPQGREIRSPLKAFLSPILWYSISHTGSLILHNSPAPLPPPLPQSIVKEQADKVQNKNRCRRKKDLWIPSARFCNNLMPFSEFAWVYRESEIGRLESFCSI